MLFYQGQTSMDKTIGFKVTKEQLAQADELRKIGFNVSAVLRAKFEEVVQEYLARNKKIKT
jgi:hypothetical protein